MYRSLILSLAFIAVVFSQSYQSTFTVTPLTRGVAYTGQLPITQPSANYHVNVHSIFIPQNATNVTITVNNANTAACSYINFFLRDEAPACSDDDFSTSTGNEYLCANGNDLGSGVGSTPYVYVADPSTYDDLFHFGVNKTWYLSAGKYGSSDYQYACSYTITVTYNNPCTAGQVGVSDYFGGTNYGEYCNAYTDIVANTVYPVSFTGVQGQGFPVYRTVVAPNTGSLQVSGWFNNSGLDFYGASYTTPYYNAYHCDVNTYETSNSTGTTTMYYYVLDCPTPRSGDFYILIDGGNSGAIIGGSMTLTEQVCTGNTGGYKCQFTNTLLTSYAPATITVPYNSTGDYYSSYSWAYYYFDTPANFRNGTISVTANTAASGSTYITLRRNGFPEANSYYGYEDSAEYQSVSSTGTSYNLAVNNFDFYVPARYYIGVSCSTSTGCAYTLSFNSTAAPAVATTGLPSTTGVGSGSATTGVSTGEQTSNAIVAAFSAIVMIFAFLF